MNLRQQLVKDRVEDTASVLQVSEDEAFLRLTHSLLVDQSIHSFDDNDLVDGGQDKQIDVITIEQDPGEARIYIVQAKNTDSFSSNALIQMKNGLDWVFNKSRTDVKRLPNQKLRDRILECRSVISGYGPSNVTVVVAFITYGITKTLSDEFKQELQGIKEKYNNKTFESFTFHTWGADELVSGFNALERQQRRINEDLSIHYDKNTQSLIRYFAQGLKGVVCSVNAQEIARIVERDTEGAIFDFNIRRFLGERKSVNTDIMTTCSNADSSYLFWFLNNGVTIVCDRMDPVTDPDMPLVKLENMQIVNGCQTATTLARAFRERKLAADTRVLVRIYETTDPELVKRIVLTTNNQNKISSRDLRANDPAQIDMQKGFSRYGYFYERKIFEFDKTQGIDGSRIVSNEIVAQSYLAIVLKKPSDARRRKYKIWSDLYNQIFGGSGLIEPYVIATRLFVVSSKWLKSSKYINDRHDLRRKLARNGAFHVARIAAHLWRGNDIWGSSTKDVSQMKKLLENLEQDSTFIEPLLEEAFQMFFKVFNTNEQYKTDPDDAFKTSSLDEEIDKLLYKSKKVSKK